MPIYSESAVKAKYRLMEKAATKPNPNSYLLTQHSEYKPVGNFVF